MQDCIFCNIIKKEIPSSIEYEDENVMVFHDIRPKAALHLLIVPKKHIESVNHAQEEDKGLMGECIMVAQKVAAQKALQGYKLHINVGKEGGQEVGHVHMHLLAGPFFTHANSEL